jgi:ribonuclease E
MAVHVEDNVTQIAMLEGRSLIEFYISRPSDDVSEIHGNIYMGRVENVLPGMEAAFVDIGTPKNAVLYQSDLIKNANKKSNGIVRIEDAIKNKETVLCQVTKNPIAHKGARLTEEISLAGRFVVLVPNSGTFGISKRLPEKERKRLRQILEKAKPEEHGVIVRTAAQHITKEEIEQDVQRLVSQWLEIQEQSSKSNSPKLLYREPEMPFRIIREEFNKEYRSVVIDDLELYEEAKSYLATVAPALADRIEYHDTAANEVALFERFYVEEQLAKALDSKVWLPSGGSLIIEHTEALTVIDVNTGKNVGTSSLEETVYRNNLEAAKEVAHQLRLRDIGGIIVIDFVDMERPQHRNDVMKTFRSELARDKTRTQVFGISELGLVEMTRKRIGEGLSQTFTKAQEDE